MTITKIYQKIVVATEDKDEEEIYYLYGRFVYYIINFDPIEEAYRALIGAEPDLDLELARPRHKKLRGLINPSKSASSSEYPDFSFDPVNQEDYLRFLTYGVDISVNFLNASIGAASANTSLCEGNYTLAEEYYILL